MMSHIDGFGWYISIKEVAEKGVFNRVGLTPLESTQQSNLYEFMLYLSACKAQSDFKNNAQ